MSRRWRRRPKPGPGGRNGWASWSRCTSFPARTRTSIWSCRWADSTRPKPKPAAPSPNFHADRKGCGDRDRHAQGGGARRAQISSGARAGSRGQAHLDPGGGGGCDRRGDRGGGALRLRFVSPPNEGHQGSPGGRDDHGHRRRDRGWGKIEVRQGVTGEYARTDDSDEETTSIGKRPVARGRGAQEDRKARKGAGSRSGGL